MTKKLKPRKWQYPPIIGLVTLLCLSFDIPSQLVRIDVLHAQEGVRRTDDFIPPKITCLQIIREDYQGLPLSYPCKVFVDSVKKEIYVADSGNKRILVYTHDFYPLLCIDKSDGVEAPVGLAVDPEGYLYIAQSATTKHKKGRVSVLNPCLRWKKDIFLEGFEGADNFNPTDIAINDKGYLYVTGTAYRGVVVLDKLGTFSHLLTPTDKLGKAPVEKATICDVKIGNRGHIYLLSEDMGRIYVYDPDERFLFKFGQKGGGSGKLSRPRGMAVDSRNKRIYVIDYMRHTASAYSDDGRFLFEFGGKGWAKGWFQYPNDIAVDTLGNVLVADTFNNRVQVLSGLTPPIDHRPTPHLMANARDLSAEKERQEEAGLDRNRSERLEEDPSIEEAKAKDRPAYEETEGLESNESTDEIKDFVYSWRDAWQQQEIERYISHYDEEFSSHGMTLNKWLKYKEGLFRAQKIKNIEIKDMKVTKSEDLVVAHFVQIYSSDKHTDVGKKHLYLKRKDVGWKIIREEWGQ